MRAAIGAPLIADGRLLGAVTANTLDPHKRFDEADVQVFELYAGQAAAVIKSVRLFESERRQRRGAEEAARAAAAIVSEMDQQRRLDLIVERAVKIVGGVAGGLDLLDPATGSWSFRRRTAYLGRPRADAAAAAAASASASSPSAGRVWCTTTRLTSAHADSIRGRIGSTHRRAGHGARRAARRAGRSRRRRAARA